MLVLTRKEREAIILQTANGPVTIVVNRIANNNVRLGIQAAPEVKILRSELEHKQCPSDTIGH